MLNSTTVLDCVESAHVVTSIYRRRELEKANCHGWNTEQGCPTAFSRWRWSVPLPTLLAGHPCEPVQNS